MHFDISNALNLTLAEKLQMRPSDIVLVRTQPLFEFNRVVRAFLGVAGDTLAAFDLGKQIIDGNVSD